MSRFERALRLYLFLVEMINNGKGDTDEADDIRDELDSYYGWCGPHFHPENRLTKEEADVMASVVDLCPLEDDGSE